MFNRLLRQLFSCLLVFLLLFPGVQLTQAQTPTASVAQKEAIKAELNELKRRVFAKIDSDAEDIARAFTTAESITRSLRVAYVPKSILNSISAGFGLVGGVTDLTDVKTKLVSADSALALATIVTALDTAREVKGDLQFAFGGDKYVKSVERMLDTARANQAKIGPVVVSFNEAQYQQDIQLWLSGSEGANLVQFVREGTGKSCVPFQPRAKTDLPVTELYGIQQLKLHLIARFKQLETDLTNRSLSLEQAETVLAHLQKVKTTVIKSGGQETTLSYRAYRPVANSCVATETQANLGRIAAYRQVLADAYEAFDKDLKAEQRKVIRTSAGVILDYTTFRLGRKAPRIIKHVISPYLTGLDVLDLAHEAVFPSTARELVVELPQQMLLNLSGEMSSLLSLIDDIQVLALEESVPAPPKEVYPTVPTLFLLDTSGSMGENAKIEQARGAALDALFEIHANAQRAATPAAVAVLSFAGPCSVSSARKLADFGNSLDQTENALRNRLPRPDGATPLPQGIQVAQTEMESYLARHPDLKEGRIIVLSDGQSTCGDIRPPGVFSRRDIPVRRNGRVTFLCIGFDVPPGSAAERDLQFLASESGGKYFPAQDRRQLARAFSKLVRVFVPKTPGRGLNGVGTSVECAAGRTALMQGDYPSALKSFRTCVAQTPNDPITLYNLALTWEALDRYKAAAEGYRRYLATWPAAPDRAELMAHITKLEQDYVDQYNYFVEVLRSDLAYLKQYYQTLFNRHNDDLAREFTGFVREKRDFYAHLPELLEVKSRWLENASKDLSDSLDTLNARVRLPTFDRDAVSLLTLPIGQLEEMVQQLETMPPR